MVYKSTNTFYDFRNFETIRAYGNEIRNNVIYMDTANIEQQNLAINIKDFVEKKTPRDSIQKKIESRCII